LITRDAALDHERPERVVRRDELDRPRASPVGERIRLVLALLVREVDLEDDGPAVRDAPRNDERDVRRLERRLERQLPALDARLDDPRQ